VHCLYNHVKLLVSYNEDPALFKGSRIVGFEVVPFSVKHTWDNNKGEVSSWGRREGGREGGKEGG
jgi:hypothetical protein